MKTMIFGGPLGPDDHNENVSVVRSTNGPEKCSFFIALKNKGPWQLFFFRLSVNNNIPPKPNEYQRLFFGSVPGNLDEGLISGV